VTPFGHCAVHSTADTCLDVVCIYAGVSQLYVDKLLSIMSKQVNDADGEARSAARQLFIAFEQHWPDQAAG